MKDWNWTPRAKAIGMVIQALIFIPIAWFFMSVGWFMLGG